MMADSNQPPTDPPIREYVLQSGYRRTMAGLLVFSIIGMAGSVTLALVNPDGTFDLPITAAILFGCPWSVMAILSLSMLLYSYRARVYTSQEGLVEVVGLFRTQTFRLDEVSRAVWWGARVGRHVVLYGPPGRGVVECLNFTDSEDLAGYFRAKLPSNVQHISTRRPRVLAVLAIIVGLVMIARGICIWNAFGNDPIFWTFIGLGTTGLVAGVSKFVFDRNGLKPLLPDGG